MRSTKYIILLSLALISWGCAQINALTGGERDTIAPQIDSAKTYPSNGQINFKGQFIKIKFDEYITLNKATENIIITPQLENKPIISAHNKKLTIEFNEELKENTTYTISFNGAVQDITEKNDSIFQFVFSTGPYIDSLSVSGRVRDGYSNQGSSGFLVALYPADIESEFDSIPYKFKPTYIGQTDEQGAYQLNYLKEGIYHLFVIQDLNKNLMLDDGEAFGFLEEKTININSQITGVNLKSFQPETISEYRINTTRFTYPGKLEFILSAPDSVLDFSVSTSMPLIQEESGQSDSLVYWLSNHPTSRMEFIVNVQDEIDTLKPIYQGIPDRGEEPSLRINTNITKGKLNPGEDLRLTFSEPIESFNPDKIHFFNPDSIEFKIIGSVQNIREIEFSTSSQIVSYAIIDSGMTQSVFGNTNDTERLLQFETYDSSYFGSLIINIDTTFSEPVLMELTNSNGDRISIIPFSNRTEYQYLLPGNYGLKLIFDSDNNGEWTTGSLENTRQPESVIYYTGELKVKSKWEKEIDWKFKRSGDGGN